MVASIRLAVAISDQVDSVALADSSLQRLAVALADSSLG